MGAPGRAHPLWGDSPQYQAGVELAITEAWRWLEINMFIVSAPIAQRAFRLVLELPDYSVGWCAHSGEGGQLIRA
jgi:hypothetical protein